MAMLPFPFIYADFAFREGSPIAALIDCYDCLTTTQSHHLFFFLNLFCNRRIGIFQLADSPNGSVLTAPIGGSSFHTMFLYHNFFFSSLFLSVSKEKQDEFRSWEDIIDLFFFICRIYDFCFSSDCLQYPALTLV